MAHYTWPRDYVSRAFPTTFPYASLARIEPVGFRRKSDLRNYYSIEQSYNRDGYAKHCVCSLSSRPQVSPCASAACQLFFERGRPALNCPGFQNHEALLPIASTELSPRQARQASNPASWLTSLEPEAGAMGAATSAPEVAPSPLAGCQVLAVRQLGRCPLARRRRRGQPQHGLGNLGLPQAACVGPWSALTRSLCQWNLGFTNLKVRVTVSIV